MRAGKYIVVEANEDYWTLDILELIFECLYVGLSYSKLKGADKLHMK